MTYGSWNERGVELQVFLFSTFSNSVSATGDSESQEDARRRGKSK
jgi:hypothetical protein